MKSRLWHLLFYLTIEPMTVIRLRQSQPFVYALAGKGKPKFKMPRGSSGERLRMAVGRPAMRSAHTCA